MTIKLSGHDMGKLIGSQFPNAVVESDVQSVIIKSDYLSAVLAFLKNGPETDFNYLTDLTAVDYQDYFEVVYRLTSLEFNHTTVVKTRCFERTNASLPSVTGLWKGADLMEREIYDLMGISFSGHPNLKRIFLWEGFSGFPLRKDYF